MTDPSPLRLATRGSPLALWQAARVADLVRLLGTAGFGDPPGNTVLLTVMLEPA